MILKYLILQALSKGLSLSCFGSPFRQAGIISRKDQARNFLKILAQRMNRFVFYEFFRFFTELLFKLRVESAWVEPRLCDYSGLFYCQRCHWNSTAVIPARVIRNWDMEPRKVCRSASQLLALLEDRPVLPLEQLNPKLFTLIPDLMLMKVTYYLLHFYFLNRVDRGQLSHFLFEDFCIFRV